MTSNGCFAGNIAINNYHQNNPYKRSRNTFVLRQFYTYSHDHCYDQDHFSVYSHSTSCVITVFLTIHVSSDGKDHIDRTCNNSYSKSDFIKSVLSTEKIRNITVCTAAKQFYENLRFDRQCFSLKNHVGQPTEHQHSCQCNNKRRDSYISDPECLPCSDECTDKKCQNNGYSIWKVHIFHKNAAQGTYKTYYGSNRKVDVSSCQDTQQHTCSQYKYVCIL